MSNQWLLTQQKQLDELIALCDESLHMAAPESHGLIAKIRRELEELRAGRKTTFDPALRRSRIDLDWDLPFFKPLGRFLDDLDRNSRS